MISLPPEPEWQQHANCADTNPDVFFPPRGDHKAAAYAKQICADCPVKTECLNHAIREGIQYGIWGGVSAKQRIVLRRRWLAGPIDHGTKRGWAQHVSQRIPVCAACRRFGGNPIEHGSEAGYVAHLRRGEDACPDCLHAHTQAAVARKRARREAS